MPSPLENLRAHEPKETSAYTIGDGPVRHLDGSPLARPLYLPESSRKVVLALLVAAAIIGAFMLFKYFDGVLGAPARAEQATQENIARQVSYDLPTLSNFMESSDDAIKQAFADAGYTTYDTASSNEYADGGFSLIKLPSDVSLAEGGVLYAQGISNLSAADAAKLLKGAWMMSVNRSGGVDMRVRYADFTSGSIDAAIQAAREAEGLADAHVAESGVDDAGNIYQAGSLEANGKTYSWRVSAIALSSVYDVKGLPDNAVYVGVRMSK